MPGLNTTNDPPESPRFFSGIDPSLPFLALFCVLFIAVTHYLGNMLPDAALGWMMHSTAFLVVRFLRMLGVAAVLEGIRVVLPGFAMKVNLECTAVHYLGIFWIGVLAYPRHRIIYKLTGVAGGTVLLIALNVLRIGVVGIVGMHSAELAAFLHTYLWQGVFAVFVLLLWVLWTKGPAVPAMPAVRFVVIFLFVSALAVLVLETVMGGYVKLLAALAAPAAHALPCTANILITTSGDMIEYTSGTRLYAYSVSTDILDSAMFFALMTASPGMGRYLHHLRLIAIGYAVLLFTHLLFVITVGAIVFRLGTTVLADIFWVLRSISVLIPILLWLIIRRIQRKMSDMAPFSNSETDGAGQRAEREKHTV